MVLVKDLLKLCKEYRATNITAYGVSVTVHPDAWAAPPASAKELLKALALPEAASCRCGHSFDEHNEHGCLHGCLHPTCAPDEEK
jgi:hypothetical protein